MPGKSRSRLSSITSSSGTKRFSVPTRMKREMPCPSGTLTRAITDSASPGLRTVTSRFSDRFETNGNGCAGSSACGVTSGKTFLM